MTPSAWAGLIILTLAVVGFIFLARSNRGKDRSNIPTRVDAGGIKQPGPTDSTKG